MRLNTRELRVKRRLTSDRDNILTRILQLNPDFTPPSDWKRPRFEKKIYVPVLEYPDCNFFGLIIGPRGQTQKQLQKETGTKIAIRGKGSFVEGKANRVPQVNLSVIFFFFLPHTPDLPSQFLKDPSISKKCVFWAPNIWFLLQQFKVPVGQKPGSRDFDEKWGTLHSKNLTALFFICFVPPCPYHHQRAPRMYSFSIYSFQ